jgi:uncharacterized Zn finger protein (UPF0148 family)
MAFYTCGSCMFSFERRGAVSDCPHCGRETVREVTAEEVVEVLRNRADDHTTGKGIN